LSSGDANRAKGEQASSSQPPTTVQSVTIPAQPVTTQTQPFTTLAQISTALTQALATPPAHPFNTSTQSFTTLTQPSTTPTQPLATSAPLQPFTSSAQPSSSPSQPLATPAQTFTTPVQPTFGATTQPVTTNDSRRRPSFGSSKPAFGSQGLHGAAQLSFGVQPAFTMAARFGEAHPFTTESQPPTTHIRTSSQPSSFLIKTPTGKSHSIYLL